MICLTTEKSEGAALCKKMPVILVYKVVVERRIMGKGGGLRRRINMYLGRTPIKMYDL
jgi:hypothetical protein